MMHLETVWMGFRMFVEYSVWIGGIWWGPQMIQYLVGLVQRKQQRSSSSRCLLAERSVSMICCYDGTAQYDENSMDEASTMPVVELPERKRASSPRENSPVAVHSFKNETKRRNGPSCRGIPTLKYLSEETDSRPEQGDDLVIGVPVSASTISCSWDEESSEHILLRHATDISQHVRKKILAPRRRSQHC